MKRKLLLPVLALTAFLGTLLSCSSDSDTASIQIPVTQIFRNVEKDILPSDTNKIKLEITLSGDAKDSRTFNWEEKERNCTFENLPVGGVVSVSAKVKDGEDLIYSVKSDKIKLKNEQNEITIKMQKLMARLTVKTDNKEIAELTDETEIVINTEAEVFSRSWTITPKEFAAGYELKYLPATGKVTITANVKDGENLLFSGSHVAENINENQGALTIQMTKLLARLTVKFDTNDIPELTENLVKILITVTDFKNTWEATPQAFSGGHEIKYLPINKELTVTAKAKTKDTTNTAIFRGSSKITITEKDQNPECTIKMERVNGDTSVEIRTLPTPELKAIYTNDTNTFSLTSKTPVALFTISYKDSSNPNINQPLPDWVTYKWKMNGTEFTPDDASTPNDASGPATFKKEEGELTINLYKMNINPLGANNNVSQNRLYVEIGMENSEETKSTEIEFTITQ